MSTPLDLITDALGELGVLGEGDTPDAAQQATALRHLVRLIDWLSTKGITVTGLLRTTKVLANGTTSYTIGTGGGINIARPVTIEFARVIQDNTADPVVEIPITVFTDQEWAAIPDKDRELSVLSGIYFDRNVTAVGSGLSTIRPYPVPNVATQTLVLYTPKAFATIALADLSTTHLFAPGVEDTLLYHLAERLATPFGRQVPPLVEKFAGQSLAALEAANASPRELEIDPSLPGMSRGGMSRSRFERGA